MLVVFNLESAISFCHSSLFQLYISKFQGHSYCGVTLEFGCGNTRVKHIFPLGIFRCIQNEESNLKEMECPTLDKTKSE